MTDMILYLVTAAIGFVIGTKLRTNKDKLFWTGKVQSTASCILLFAMSARIGSNQEIIENLKSIGLYAFVFTLIIFACTLISVYVARKFLGFDKRGNFVNLANKGSSQRGLSNGSQVAPPNNSTSSNDIKSSGFVLDRITGLLLLFVVLGVLFGHFLVDQIWTDYEIFTIIASMTIRIGLCLLLFFVGADLGLEGTIVENFRQIGLRVLLFPLATLVGTLIGSVICYFFIPVTMKEALAIGAGLGWYSMAPAIIMDAGHITASAISFLHNVMREFFSILIIPFVARYLGYIEATGTAGAPSMDICLPVIERSSNSTMAVYGFISGVTLTILVPIIVPIIINF